jgi:hypothetical protein
MDFNFSIFSINMDNIIEPNENFDFSKLSLAHPSGIQGGAYFTKIEYNKKPLYIQTCKSQTRQGFVKTGKKYYCDLMFDKNAESLIHWFENLEERCQKLIFEKRDTWFQNSLEESDIETAFNSIIRVYKSGKYYLVRTNVKNNSNNLPSIKIYNEDTNALTFNDVSSETNIISILEIQGIKFTSRNFQIEIDLKQVMVLENEPVFDNCLIKNSKKSQQPSESIKEYLEDVKLNLGNNDNDDLIIENTIENTIENNETIKENNEENVKNNLEEIKDNNNVENNLEELETLEPLEPLEFLHDEEKEDENISLDLEIEDLNEDIEENTNDLKELNFDLPLENSLETIQLKKPNQVYFELYKEARNKAKVAKKNALLAYLEAKNIKKTYLIENLNDSDSDIDDEIDEVSESELEGL